MSDELVWGELDSEDYAYVHRLAIKPDLHGQRLGLHILRQAEIIARTYGQEGNPVGLHAGKFGFEEIL